MDIPFPQPDPATPSPQRAPRLEAVPGVLRVLHQGQEIALSGAAVRLTEEGRPAVVYLPREDLRSTVLRPVQGATWSSWKGRTEFFDIVSGGRRARRAAWSHPRPSPPLEELRGRVGFLTGKVQLELASDAPARLDRRS